jgi:hypothetical protein
MPVIAIELPPRIDSADRYSRRSIKRNEEDRVGGGPQDGVSGQEGKRSRRWGNGGALDDNAR